MELQVIQNCIYEIRDQKVMLDSDLAEIYQVETKQLKRAVKRNIERFPPDFMFELTENEWDILRCHIGTSKLVELVADKRGGNRYRPFVFTEQGVAQLSSVLHSDFAIQMNIAIVRAFVSLRQYALGYAELNRKLENFMVETNLQFNDVFKALEELAEQKKVAEQPRRPIGFQHYNYNS